MKKIHTLISAFAVVVALGAPLPVLAADCASEARVAASSLNAEVLNVVDLGDGNCEVTLRIPGKDGAPPRVVTKKLKG